MSMRLLKVIFLQLRVKTISKQLDMQEYFIEVQLRCVLCCTQKMLLILKYQQTILIEVRSFTNQQ